MSSLCQGRLVWTLVADPRGKNPKHRPVVILTSNKELKTAKVAVGVVASHSAASVVPLPDHHIALPYQQNGLCTSKLRKPTVAICDWLAEVPNEPVSRDNLGGVITPMLLAKILEKIKEMESTRLAPSSQTNRPSEPNP